VAVGCQAIRDTASGAEQFSLAQQIFGKGGPQLLGTIRTSTQDMRALFEEAKRLGVAISEVDASRIAVLDQEIKRAQDSMSGFGNNAASVLAPLWDAFARIKQGVAEQNLLFNNTFGRALLGLTQIVDKYTHFSERAKEAAASQRAVAEANRPAAEEFENASASAERNARALKAMQDAGRRRENLIREFMNPRERFEEKEREIIEAIKQVNNDAEKLPLIGGVTDKPRLDLLRKQHKELQEALRRLRADEAERQKGLADVAMPRDPPRHPLEGVLERLQAQRDFLESKLSLNPADTGPERAAALEHGTAAAFSASFGAKPIEKNTEALLRVNKQILEVQRRIEQKQFGKIEIGP
jgi:hypothetical protein